MSNDADLTRIPDVDPNSHPFAAISDQEQALRAGYEADERALRALLTRSDATTRSLALSGLQRANLLTEDDVAAGLIDAHWAVRRRSLELVAELRGVEHEAKVVALCDSDEPLEVELAAFTLGELGPANNPQREASVERLESLAANADDALVREAAVAALGSLGRGLDTILAALNDKATVRRRAVIALAPFEGPEVTAALAKALDDRDWQVRQAAEELQTRPDDQ